MILTDAVVKVRHLLDQTSSSDTQFDDSNFIEFSLNEARRYFASLLPEFHIPKLIKSTSLTVTSGIGAYPVDFLRLMLDSYTTVGSVVARRIPESDRWRLNFLEANDLIKSGTVNKYFYERSDGIYLFPTSSTACVYQYIKAPTQLSTPDNVEMPAWVDDLVIQFSFEKCMGTRRGDVELAAFLLKKRDYALGKMLA